MPIYIAVPLQPSSQSLDEAVATTIAPDDAYQLQANRGWLIKFPGTTRELSDALKITGHEKGQHSVVGSTLITPVSSYFGLGPNDMWEWLKNRLEQ